MNISHINPDSLPRNPAFSQAEQALRNVLAALEAAGASQENVLKLTAAAVADRKSVV